MGLFLLEKVRKGEIMNKENSDVITRIKVDLSSLDGLHYSGQKDKE